MLEQGPKPSKKLREQVAAIVAQSEVDNVPIGVIARTLRESEAANEAAAFVAAVGPVLPAMAAADWAELKTHMQGPAEGKVRLGKVRQDADAALESDDQAAFWTALLLGLKMLRKHASTVSF